VAGFAQYPPRFSDKPPRFGKNAPGFGQKVFFTLHFSLFTFHSSLFTFHFSLLSGAPGVSNFIPARARVSEPHFTLTTKNAVFGTFSSSVLPNNSIK